MKAFLFSPFKIVHFNKERIKQKRILKGLFCLLINYFGRKEIKSFIMGKINPFINAWGGSPVKVWEPNRIWWTSGSFLSYLFKIWPPQPNTLYFLCSVGKSDELEHICCFWLPHFFVGYLVVIMPIDTYFKLYFKPFVFSLETNHLLFFLFFLSLNFSFSISNRTVKIVPSY